MTPSQRFLRMLPPAVLAADDDPVVLALLGALEEQWLALAGDIDTVLDDAFPDSARDEALPQIGGLLGLPADAGRREIAYATALRRRKGTPAAVEDFAEIVTGWAARVTEGWRTTLWAQQLRHPRRYTASLDLRAGEHLLARTGLDPARHSVTPGGPHHPAAVTATVFPWQVPRFDRVETRPLPDGRLALHPFGASVPLYLPPRPLVLASDAEDERPPGVAPAPRAPRSPAELPVRATYRMLDALGDVSYGPVWTLAADHPLRSSALVEIIEDGTPVPWSRIGLTGLSPGTPIVPAADQVLLDPNRGVLLPGAGVTGVLQASFFRAVPGALGPLVSDVRLREDVGVIIVVDPDGGPHPAGQTVVADLPAAINAALAATTSTSAPDAPQVEIRLLTGHRLTAAAVTGTPALTRWRIVAPRDITPVVVGDLGLDVDGLEIELAGFYLDGDLVVGPSVASVDLISIALNAPAGRTVRLDKAAWTTRMSATRCLLGPIRADLGAHPLTLVDCLVDGTGAQLMPCGGDGGGSPSRAALAATDRFPPDLVATAVTFVGPVGAGEVWVTDCLFTAGLRTTITSSGCVRFCHLGPHDQPQAHPSGYRCLTGPLPRFGSTGFDAAGYYAPVLDGPSARPAHALLTGASDGGEIGAYHHARRAPLALRLAQRLPDMTPLTVHPHLAVAHPEE